MKRPVPPSRRKKRAHIGVRLRFAVLQACGFRCAYCGVAGALASLEVDHVVPVAAGGTNAPSNLVAACERCNSGKADRPLLWAPQMPWSLDPCVHDEDRLVRLGGENGRLEASYAAMERKLLGEWTDVDHADLLSAEECTLYDIHRRCGCEPWLSEAA